MATARHAAARRIKRVCARRCLTSSGADRNRPTAVEVRSVGNWLLGGDDWERGWPLTVEAAVLARLLEKESDASK